MIRGAPNEGVHIEAAGSVIMMSHDDPCLFSD